MAHEIELLKILAIGFSAALALGYLTFRLKLSPIVGYLLAGFLIGPHSPGFVADARITGELAEVGVILLMFGVGLHFDPRELLAVQRIAIPGAVGQSLVAAALGMLIGLAFGMTWGAGLVLGLGVAVASTVVLMRVLTDRNLLETVHGHVAVGWLIVEDIFTVLVLVMLPALAAAEGAGTGAHPFTASFLLSLGGALFRLLVFGVLILIFGGRVVPWLMGWVARTRSKELFTLAVLALAFVIAVGASILFGASMALGAFLAGIVVGKSEVSHQAAADVLPLRDAFAVLFFLSVGMLFDPAFIVAHPGLVLAVLAVILIAKPLAAALIVIALGSPVRTALVVAFGLAQVGEFSFILAQQAQALRLLPEEGTSALVAGALISITLNPPLFRLLDPLENALRRRPRLWRWLDRRSEEKARGARQKAAALREDQGVPRAVVIGYGPVGQRAAELLRGSGLATVIIDLNVDTISRLAADGHAAIYGDGRQRDILQAAGTAEAQYLLVTLPDLPGALSVITVARELNPRLRILVRARHQSARPTLESLGVTAVAIEEEEVAQAMANTLLQEVNHPPNRG